MREEESGKKENEKCIYLEGSAVLSEWGGITRTEIVDGLGFLDLGKS